MPCSARTLQAAVRRGTVAAILTGLASAALGATAPGAAVPRPARDPGDGFFVQQGLLYDPAGHVFRIRGVNRLHWDSDSAAGIERSGANTVRWDIDFSRPAQANVALIRRDSIARHNVAVVGNWSATCSSDPARLSAIVATWVEQAKWWTPLNRYLIVNIANEWGPGDSTSWRDAYISAVGRLRAAGYTGPLLIDSGGCGQDDADLIKYSEAVLASDPQRNLIFAQHLYGATNDDSAQIAAVTPGNPTVLQLSGDSSTHPFASGYDGRSNSYSGITAYEISGARGMTQLNGLQPAPPNVGGTPGAWTITLNLDSRAWPTYTGGGTIVDYFGNFKLKITRLAQLARQTGAVYIVGEFGPGRGIGASPTRVTPAQILTTAEAEGVGWLAWAWDDNNLPNAGADDRGFSMTYRGPGQYTRPEDLTAFGREVVLNPVYGLKTLARPASIF
jgi:hypothetical protein